jgi:hypothetical protein
VGTAWDGTCAGLRGDHVVKLSECRTARRKSPLDMDVANALQRMRKVDEGGGLRPEVTTWSALRDIYFSSFFWPGGSLHLYAEPNRSSPLCHSDFLPPLRV